MITARLNVAMSSDLNATIQSLVASLPPGTEVEVQIATLVFRSAGGEVGRPQTVIESVPSQAAPHESTAARAAVDRSRMAALQRVEARVAEFGEEALKVKDWAALVFRGGGPSGRELRRAVGAGLLRHSTKAIGKDAGATLVDSQDLVEYLREREVALRNDSPPEIWSEVVGGRSRRAA